MRTFTTDMQQDMQVQNATMHLGVVLPDANHPVKPDVHAATSLVHCYFERLAADSVSGSTFHSQNTAPLPFHLQLGA